MKHLIITIFLNLLSTTPIWLQISTNGKLQITFEPNTMTRFGVFDNNSLSITSPDVSMRIVRTTKDSKGGEHDRYDQYYRGKKVIGTSAVVHSINNQAESVTGYIEDRFETVADVPDIDENTATSISSLMLADILKNEHNIKLNGSVNPKTESISLCIVNELYPKKDGDLVLAYEVTQSINIWNQPVKRVQYINAVTGKPIQSINKIILHKSKGSGLSNFYGKVSFDHDSISPTEYHLRDFSRGNGVFVQNLKTEEGYTNSSSDWNFSNASDKSAVDVMYGAQKFYDLLQDRFNFNSLDNKGFPLVGKVNNFLYTNAFWDGETTTYGGGDCNQYRSFTTLDVIGHEFAHGFTEFNSALVYSGESGNINEAISDIFGKALEYYTLPDQFTWTVGNKIPYSGTSPFRSMSNPNALEQPKYYKGSYWSESLFDGPHQNNGVMNYWFYLIVNGGKGKDEKGKPFELSAIGMDKAIDLVFLLNTAYLYSTSDYRDVYENSKLAAAHLFGEDSEEYKSVVTAWGAVGLPYTPIENKDLVLSFAINGDDDLNPFECYEANKKLDFTITNTSKVTIPAGTSIFAKIIGEYDLDGVKKVVYLVDTVLLLTDSLAITQSLNLSSNIQIPESVTYILYQSEIKMEFNSTKYKNVFIQSMQYKKNATDPEDYFYTNYMYNDIENVCDKKSKINSTSAFVNHNLCNKESFIFETVYENGTTSKSIHELKTVDPNRFSNFIYLNIEAPDLSAFEDKSEIYTHIYVWIKDVRYLIFSDTLAKYFLQPMVKDEVINFEQMSDFSQEKRLQIQPGTFINTNTTGSNLNLTNSWQSTVLDDCANIEDFYQNVLTDVYKGLDISNIRGCPITEDMTDPHLSFDVSLNTLPNVSGDDHRHGLMVFQDETMIEKPISNTNRVIKTYQIPLPKGNNAPFDLKLYLDGSEGILDNIHIFDKHTTFVKDHQNLRPFNISNPNTESITIWWGDLPTKSKPITIYDMNGQILVAMDIMDMQSEIDCSSWPAGMYRYKIKDQNRCWDGKIVVVK